MTEQRQLTAVERIIEPAAGYEQKLSSLGKEVTQEQLQHIQCLSQEYHILRISLVSRGAGRKTASR